MTAIRTRFGYSSQQPPIPDAPPAGSRSKCLVCGNTGWKLEWKLIVALLVKDHRPIEVSRREGNEEMVNTLCEQLVAAGFDAQVISATRPCSCRTQLKPNPKAPAMDSKTLATGEREL